MSSVANHRVDILGQDVILDVSGFVLRKLFSVLPVTTEIINASFKTVVQVQNVVKRHYKYK